jgi:hypothetical protein
VLYIRYTFFIRYPRFDYIRHDITTNYDDHRKIYYDWAGLGLDGNGNYGHSLAFFLRLFVLVSVHDTRHSLSIFWFGRHLHIATFAMVAFWVWDTLRLGVHVWLQWTWVGWNLEEMFDIPFLSFGSVEERWLDGSEWA